jgi:hypothetical protein
VPRASGCVMGVNCSVRLELDQIYYISEHFAKHSMLNMHKKEREQLQEIWFFSLRATGVAAIFFRTP